MRFQSFFLFFLVFIVVFGPIANAHTAQISVEVDIPGEGNQVDVPASAFEVDDATGESDPRRPQPPRPAEIEMDPWHDGVEDDDGTGSGGKVPGRTRNKISNRRNRRAVHQIIRNELSHEERNRIANLPACGPYADAEVTRGVEGNRGMRINTVSILPEHRTRQGIQDNTISTGAACMFHRLRQAAASAGHTLTLNSGFRTLQSQQYFRRCFETNSCNINPRTGKAYEAAPAGTSNHGNGNH